MIQGAGESLVKSTAMNIFTPSPHADAFLTEPKPVLLPKLKVCSGNVLTTNLASSESAIITKKRNSKGCQALPIIRDLLSNPECWFDIKGSSDYQFPGKLECECNIALFPGPAQLFVAFCTNSDRKLGGAWEQG